MEKVKQSFSLQCPAHPAEKIGLLNVDHKAKKIGYCYDCLGESDEDGAVIKALKPVSSYLKDTSNFYEKCRQRAHNDGEPPAEFLEELSKKGERNDNFLQHIDQEKCRVEKSFNEIRRIVEQIINDKEKECFELLDKETSRLLEAYRDYENLFMIGWPKPSDIQNIFPGIDQLKERMSQIKSMDQLQAFMTGIQEDIKTQDFYFKEENGLSKIKTKMNDLIHGMSIPDCSLPKIQSQIFNSENIESLMKDLMKGFTQQEIQVENSVISRFQAPAYGSKIIADEQFETLRNWLPQGYKFDLKLLFRGSFDGMSAGEFHEKCDAKGATITLIKCHFNGALSSKTVGGFLDQSWHSRDSYSISKEAFLFSLAEQSGNSVKCPILESYFGNAFQGHPQYGPMFGKGSDLYLETDLTTGGIYPSSYSNAGALKDGNESVFNVEEVEVFQVL
jgi:hypothetical protein